MVNRFMRYILKGKTPVQEPDLIKWGEWYEQAHISAELQVDRTTIEDVDISTIFLGLPPAGELDSRRPRLFETMIFGGKHAGERLLCRTWTKAELNHKQAIQMVIESIAKQKNKPTDEPDKAP